MLRRLQQQNEEQRRMLEAFEAELQAENDTVPSREVVEDRIEKLLRKKGQIK
jgi:hypothetical protein